MEDFSENLRSASIVLRRPGVLAVVLSMITAGVLVILFVDGWPGTISIALLGPMIGVYINGKAARARAAQKVADNPHRIQGGFDHHHH